MTEKNENQINNEINLILDNVDAFDSIEKLGEFIGRETSKIGNPEEYSKCINLIGKKLNKILFARVTNQKQYLKPRKHQQYHEIL